MVHEEVDLTEPDPVAAIDYCVVLLLSLLLYLYVNVFYLDTRD